MKHYLLPLVIVLGIIILFFFPEPETNFIAYIGTMLFFIVLIVLLLVWKKKRFSSNKD